MTATQTPAATKGAKDEMFPKAKASSLDMVERGARMAARKDDLLAQPT